MTQLKVGIPPTADLHKQENMTTEITKEQKQAATIAISEQLDIARAAFTQAEQIATTNGVGFSFDLGDGEGNFYVYKSGDGFSGYWEGWQGSNC